MIKCSWGTVQIVQMYPVRHPALYSVWEFFVGLQEVSEKHEVEKRRPRRSEEIINALWGQIK